MPCILRHTYHRGRRATLRPLSLPGKGLGRSRLISRWKTCLPLALLNKVFRSESSGLPAISLRRNIPGLSRLGACDGLSRRDFADTFPLDLGKGFPTGVWELSFPSLTVRSTYLCLEEQRDCVELPLQGQRPRSPPQTCAHVQDKDSRPPKGATRSSPAAPATKT